MSIDDDLINAIRREVERQMSGRYNTRTGLVTGYDPKTHSAKVMLKPDDTETGWLPIHTGHIGNGFGIAIGLTPGDGKSTGDQVEVTFGEGDLEQGRVIHRLHSDQDHPPPVESGEIVVKHQTGGSIFWDKNGNIKITGGKGQADQSQSQPPPTATSKPGAQGSGLDQSSHDVANGQTVLFDTQGNITHTGIKGQTTVHDVQGNIIHTGIKGQTVTIDPNGNINENATQGNHTRTVSGTISDVAAAISHSGPTSVTGTLGVSGLLSGLGGAVFGSNSFSVDAAGNLLATSFTAGVVNPSVGDVLYRGASHWDSLNASTSGYVLTTQGAGSPPIWAIPGAGSSNYLGAFTVALLPASPVAWSWATATNGRKVGEGAGSGTGVPVYFATVWRTFSSDQPVQS